MDDATKKAMAALDTMADIWAAKVRLRDMVSAVSGDKEKIYSLILQAYVEGAYQHHCDAKAGKVPHLTYNGLMSRPATKD